MSSKDHQIIAISSSSSSSSSSYSSTSETSSSSSSSNQTTTTSSDTIYHSMRVVSGQQNKMPQESEDFSTQTRSSSNGQRLATQVLMSTNKRYKNSPFGLKNHFLSMPDSNEDHDNDALSNQPYCPEDLSSSASEAGLYSESHQSTISNQWNEYNQTNHMRQLSQPKSSLRLHELMTPAGDAGLDAPSCNNKDSHKLNGLHSSPDHLRLKTHLDDEKQESSNLLVIFSSIMYGTFLVILGCIFHISELRQKSKNSSDHIYTIIVALIGISWLMFLQIDLHRYKKFASRYILIESIYTDHQEAKKQAEERVLGASRMSPATSSSASLVNDRLSMNTEVIFKKTAYKMYQQHQSALDRERNHLKQVLSSNANKGRFSKPKRNLVREEKLGVPSSNSSENLDETGFSGTSSSKEHLEPAYKFLHGKMGANFYLKCGMAAFCFGHVIHEGLRFGQQFYFFGVGNVHCRDLAALIAHLITPLYSFYQLFMMFKYSNLVINRNKVLAKFGLMHIIGTSITFWFRTIMEEAFEDFVHKMDYFKSNRNKQINETEVSNSMQTFMSSTISDTITPQMIRHIPDSYACAQNTLLTTKSMNALPYLYPFTIEYNLLLAATFLSLYINIGKVGNRGTGSSGCRYYMSCSGSQNYPHYLDSQSKASTSLNGSGITDYKYENSSSATRSGSSISAREKDSVVSEYKSNFVVNADCHSANKGLFCGFFVLLVAIVTIVIFFVTINKPSHVQLGIKINLIQEVTLTMLVLIVTLFGLKQIAKLNKNPYIKDKVTTDDVLMLIPLPFFFIHSLLSFRAETASMAASCNGSFLCLYQTPTFNEKGGGAIDPSQVTAINQQARGIRDEETFESSLNRSLDQHESTTNGRSVGLFISSSDNNEGDIINGNNSDNFVLTDRIRTQNLSNSRTLIASNRVDSSAQIDHFKLITVALNIIVMIEVLVQTNFIIDGMRRCSESRYLRFKKPGRELITFAILLNITYWIVATFETKSVEQYKTEIEYYGPLPYMFISHTTLPVMLFYRYHSSVCLTEIWNKAYKPPKKV